MENLDDEDRERTDRLQEQGREGGVIEVVKKLRDRCKISIDDEQQLDVVDIRKVHVQRSECREINGRTLYPYQEAALRVLETTPTNNLLVVAPTGAGKTVVISAAAQLTRERNQRLFVTEPLIALVEQVYNRLMRDGDDTPYRDIDMRTGPSVRITEDDPIITVCTYEVLARICCSDPGQLQGCSWVVIDELHFLSGDRGPVIQEILDRCREEKVPIVGLSGTLSNEHQVASYLSRLNGLPTAISSTTIRPVRLAFWYYDIMNRGGNFCSLRPQAHWDPCVSPDASALGGLRGRQPLLNLIAKLQEWDCFPVLLVNFSCSVLDEWAAWAASTLDFLDRRQKAEIVGRFNKLLRSVPEEDHVLFEGLRSLAEKGIGIHHSHHPVQYLELVSVLAEKRLMRLVFSTSTLSAGINLPVRTVCLCQARLPQRRSEDSSGFVTIDPLLLQQLAGRAGRPGYETIGNVVFVGKGSEGWSAAAGLLAQSLPRILPPDDYTEGDVMRSALYGRALVLDRAAFMEPSTMKLAKRVKKMNIIHNELMKIIPTDVWRAAHQISSAVDKIEQVISVRGDGIMKLPSVMASSRAPAVKLALGPNGQYLLRRCESDSDSSTPSWATKDFLLRSTSKPKSSRNKVSIQDFEASTIVSAAVTQLVEAVSLDIDDALLNCTAEIVRAIETARRTLERVPSFQIYRNHEERLRQSGLLSQDGAPTPLGVAAAHLRSTAYPSIVFDAFVSRDSSQTTYDEFIAHSSMLIGAGRPDEAPVEESDLQATTRRALLDRGAPVTNSAFTTATQEWARGATLAELHSTHGVSCGEMCRHIVRIADVLTELILVYGTLGIPVPDELSLALEKVRRGLPFLRRGEGSR